MQTMIRELFNNDEPDSADDDAEDVQGDKDDKSQKIECDLTEAQNEAQNEARDERSQKSDCDPSEAQNETIKS